MKNAAIMGTIAIMAFLMATLGMTTEIAHATPIVIQHTYSFSIGIGDYWTTTSELNDDLFGSTTGTGYADKYILEVTEKERVKIEVVDHAPTGDTIALIVSLKNHWSATSPDTIVVLTPKLDPGTYTFYVGYIQPNAGVFPASYEIHVAGFKW